MSKLDDAFEVDRVVAKELRLFAELSTTSKKEIRALFLELIGDVKLPSVPTDTELGAYHVKCDLRKKVNDL